jgi:hypothetical protein
VVVVQTLAAEWLLEIEAIAATHHLLLGHVQP